MRNELLFLIGSIAVIVVGVYYTKWSFSRRGNVVNTTSGRVEGIVSVSRDGRDFEEWLGIPYAEPPVGRLRFADPQPVTPWTGVRDASQYGSGCAQVLPLGSISVSFGNEDCLFLNVHSPKTVQKEVHMAKLPVMVWFHGGAYLIGSSSHFPPDYFMDEDVVLVTVNYRLNVFGFLCPGGPHIRGNMGLKDQILALEWVRDNIQVFGGDPKRVTIFGESAGAAIVHHHMLSPTTRGLFHKVIAQSGVATLPWAIHSAEDARKLVDKLATSVGCNDPVGNSINSSSSMELATCLRSKSHSQLLQAVTENMDKFCILRPCKCALYFRPCIIEAADGDANNGYHFINEHPLDVLADGRAHRIPLMIGAMADEGLLTTMALLRDVEILNTFENNWSAIVALAFGISENSAREVEITDKLREYYVPNWRELTRDRRIAEYTKMLSDAIINLHMHHVIETQRDFSAVYAYHYTRRGGASLSPTLAAYWSKWPLLSLCILAIKTNIMNVLGLKGADYFGVSHGDDLAMLSPVPFAFINIPRNEQDPDYLFSKAVVKLWVDFASSTDPAVSLHFRGTAFLPTGKNGSVEYFDITEDHPGMIRAQFEDRVAFLKSLGLLRPQSA